MADLKEMTLGRRIQALRKQQGLTQDALGELMGVSAQAVSKWENDQSCPDIMTLPQLARVLEVSVDLLLTGTERAAAPAAPAKRPEELIIRIAIEEDTGTRVCVNLPFIVFRHAAMHGMLSVTYNPTDGADEVDFNATAQRLKQLDFKTIAQMIESGVTGKILDLNEDGDRLTVWTE